MEQRHVLSVLVKNSSGVLSRVSGLFSRRGYNIDSLTVGKTEEWKNLKDDYCDSWGQWHFRTSEKTIR